VCHLRDDFDISDYLKRSGLYSTAPSANHVDLQLLG
jgi:hypothetical protein